MSVTETLPAGKTYPAWMLSQLDALSALRCEGGMRGSAAKEKPMNRLARAAMRPDASHASTPRSNSST